MSNDRGAVAVRPVAPHPDRTRKFGPRDRARFWIRAWWPVALGIAIIMLESTEMMGSDHTSGPLRRIYQAIFGPVGDERWELIHHLIRKSGHFLGYGFIGVAWLRAWWMSLPHSRFLSDFLLALLGTGLLATWDEWHQGLLPNRTSSPWDVLLDCCGALSVCLVTYLFVRLFRPQRLKA